MQFPAFIFHLPSWLIFSTNIRACQYVVVAVCEQICSMKSRSPLFRIHFNTKVWCCLSFWSALLHGNHPHRTLKEYNFQQYSMMSTSMQFYFVIPLLCRLCLITKWKAALSGQLRCTMSFSSDQRSKWKGRDLSISCCPAFQFTNVGYSSTYD